MRTVVFNHLDEQTLAADFRQRRIQNLVALGLDPHQLHAQPRMQGLSRF